MNNNIYGDSKIFKTNFARPSVLENKTNLPTQSSKDSDKKKTAAIIGGLAALALASAGVVYAVKKMQFPKLKNIKFENGIATKGGKKFTGTIKDTLKTGEKVELTYSNGVIQQSIKRNKDAGVLKKTFKYGTEHGNIIITEDTTSGIKKYSTAKKDGNKFVREFFEIKDTRDIDETRKTIKQTGRIIVEEDGAIQICNLGRKSAEEMRNPHYASGNLNLGVQHFDITKGWFPIRHEVFNEVTQRHIIRFEGSDIISNDVAEKIIDGKAVLTTYQQFGK